MPAVYDEEKTKADELRDITGIDKAEEKAMEARAHDGLAEAEANGGETGNDKASNNELDKLNDQVGKGYTDDNSDGSNKTGIKAKLSGKRKQGIIAGSLVTLAVGAGGMGFLAAPNYIVNHLREVLLGKISQLQNFQARRYRRRWMHRTRDMFSVDGRRASKMMTDMELRGYQFDFGTPRTSYVQRIRPPGSRDFLEGHQMRDHIDQYMEIRHPLRTSRWKTKRTEVFYARNKIPRRSPVETGQDYDDPERQINRKMAEEALDEADIDAETRRADSDTPDDTPDDSPTISDDELRDMVQSDGSLDEIKEKLKNGTPLSELSDQERRLARMGAEFDNELVDLINDITREAATSPGTVFKSVKGAVVATDILDRICTVKRRLQAVVIAARLYRARSLLRLAASFVKASDDTRRGNVDPKLMNALFKRITAIDSNGYPIGASPGFAYIMKNKFSKSGNDEFKGSFGVDGKLTGSMKTLQDNTDIPGCEVYQNVAFQAGVLVVEVGAAFFTGGASSGGIRGGITTAKAAVQEAVKSAIQRGITRSMVRRGLLQVGQAVAVEVTFEMAMTFVQLYAEKSMSLNFTGQEKGAELGNILAAGAGTLNKQRSLQGGMVPATTRQIAQAQTEYLTWKKEETKKQSLYTRIFDYDNYDSVAFNLASTVAFMPMSPAALGSSIGSSLGNTASMILSNPANIVASLGSMYGTKAIAQDGDEISFETLEVGDDSLATDPAGNLLPIMPSGVENIDPETNIQELIEAGQINQSDLQPTRDSDFAKHVENCVEGLDTISIIENEDQNQPENDCLAKLPLTKKFKAHLAYLDMADGIDAFFSPEEISSSSGESSNTSANPASGDIAEPSYASNPAVRVDGAPPGPHRESNCTGTFTAGAGSLRAIILERWSPQVTSIGGYSCRKNTASPGTSIHGLGRALDITIDGTSPEGLQKGNEIRNWLINNSTQLGVQRVIWNNHTWLADKDGWRDYTGPNAHIDHIHAEINLEASTNGNLGR